MEGKLRMDRRRSTCLLFIALAFLFLLPSCLPREIKDEPRPLGKLAYVQDGNIWVKALPDGEAIQLTTDGKNFSPRWSPSGRWIAYKKGRDYDSPFWIMRSDGKEPRRIGRLVEWSPEADRLAFFDGRDLGLVNADGTGATSLKLQEAEVGTVKEVSQFIWSPDGSQIACRWWERSHTPDDAILEKQGISRFSLGEGKEAEIYTVPLDADGKPGEMILAGWDREGKYLLLWQTEILSASLYSDGAPLYALSAHGGIPREVEECMLANPDFLASSPKEPLLALVEGCGRETWTNKRIVLVDPASGKRTALTGKETATLWPSWSPDGRKIAFTAGPDVGESKEKYPDVHFLNRRIWVMNANGSEKRKLTDDAAFQDNRPLWSADGSRLLFARFDQNERVSLWMISAEGDRLSRVVDALTPAPKYGWFSNHGDEDWGAYFDWWRR
jgi:dipeptidyl aminopeptidase/acylaminoacyl peptidase